MKDVITPTVYARQKHPFLSPPATLHPEEPLHALMQDTLRGKAGGDVPFLDQKKIVAALDSRADPAVDAGQRTVMDQPLTLALSFVFTRLASLGGIGFLLLFYLCNPPFIGYFYTIPSEGSYLIVNKNLVELAALVVVFATGSGKFAGLDRIVHGLLVRRPRLATA